MRNDTARWFVVAGLVAGIGIAVYWLSAGEPERALTAVSSAGQVAEGTPSLAEKTAESPVESSEKRRADNAGCIGYDEIDTHPLFEEDLARFAATLAEGPAIEAYRGLSPEQVDVFARQGDSAALVVAGAMAELRAANVDESLAVASLSFEAHIDDLEPPFDENESRELELAASLYYEAALRGRIGVLWRYSEVLDLLHGGPVGLGWISAAEYEDLDAKERYPLYPNIVYLRLAEEIGADLMRGPHGIVSSKLQVVPTSDRQARIVSTLLEEFETERKRRGLPPLQFEPPHVSDPNVVLDMLCDNVKSGMELDD